MIEKPGELEDAIKFFLEDSSTAGREGDIENLEMSLQLSMWLSELKYYRDKYGNENTKRIKKEGQKTNDPI